MNKKQTRMIQADKGPRRRAGKPDKEPKDLVGKDNFLFATAPGSLTVKASALSGTVIVEPQDRTEVVFKLPNGKAVAIRRRRDDYDCVTIDSNDIGSRVLVAPVASNMLRVRVEEN